MKRLKKRSIEICLYRLPFKPRRARPEEIPTRVLTEQLEKEAAQGPGEQAEAERHQKEEGDVRVTTHASARLTLAFKPFLSAT